MRKKTITAICEEFDKWVHEQVKLNPVCKPGCSNCCTQNVTLTAMEGETILNHILEQDMVKWFGDVLGKALKDRSRIAAPKSTINQFAQKCFAEQEPDPDEHLEEEQLLSSCPFLEKKLCRIYPVRPFNCRLFYSSSRCTKTQPAVLPSFYIDAATVGCQLIEHLGQKEYWGNMLDVLAALLDSRKYKDIASQLEKYGPELMLQAKLRVLPAQPLPGFLIEEHYMAKVEPLINAIFSHTIDGKIVENILNGQ